MGTGRLRREPESRDQASASIIYSRAPPPSRRPSHNGSRAPNAAAWLRPDCWRDDAGRSLLLAGIAEFERELIRERTGRDDAIRD